MRASKRGKTVTVIGAGNIGSFLVSHLARFGEIARVILVDHDRYEKKNIAGQDICRRDIDREKVRVQATHLKRVRPDIEVCTYSDRAENVPMGCLRADIIATCLDSRASRLAVSQMAWRLGIPMVDAGVEPCSLLAKVGIYIPGPVAPCYECIFSDVDYRALEQVYACDGNTNARPTNAPSGLGALAASLQALECRKLLRTDEPVAGGTQFLIDATNHKSYLTTLRHNKKCRFDHETWKTTRLNRACGDISLGSLLAPAGRRQQPGAVRLSVERMSFVTRLACEKCRAERGILRLHGRLRSADKTCSRCGGRLVAAGFHMTDAVDLSVLSPQLLKRTLAASGLVEHDIFTVQTADGETHYEICGR